MYLHHSPIPTLVPEFSASSVPLMRYINELISANGACIFFSHLSQLKSIVSALYNSGDGCTKHFFKNGSFFGWKTIKELWQREIKRTDDGCTKIES